MAAIPRSPSSPLEIAIIGAGPIGLEAALYASALGHRPTVYERLEAGANIRRWGFLRLFSSWKLNTSPLGLAALEAQGLPIPQAEEYPGGGEYCDRYLAPLAAALGDGVKTGHEILAISRAGLLKTEAIASPERARRPFELLVRNREEELETAEAQVVIDASGVYQHHGSLGSGGVPAPGEKEFSEKIAYHIPDVLGDDRSLYGGRSTLLVGAGYSAATIIDSFIELMEAAPGTRLTWARRDTRPEPLPRHEDDPLPQRDRLAETANLFAESPPKDCEVLTGLVTSRIEESQGRLRVELRGETPAERRTLEVDRVISMTGYRPDTSIHRELQVHLCYATEGPMKLAAALLGEDSNGDCLARKGLPGDTLSHPEPGFFSAGHKSYGRRSDFLLQTGIEQVRDIFRLVERDEDLDLYDEADSS